MEAQTPDPEQESLRAVALRNAEAIDLARQRAEEELVRANRALEARTLELSDSLSLMQATLEATADGILVTGSDGCVVSFNEKFLQIWGLSRDKLIGASHAELVDLVAHHFVDPQRLGSRIATIYDTNEGESLDVLNLVDGRVIERYSRPQQPDARIVGRVWSYRDITARRQIEETMRDEARVLDLLNRTGNSIAANLDLETLLQTVTDAATELSGAEIGAFFYFKTDDAGTVFTLYTLSGAPRSAFDKFGHPRATPLFAPTFAGQAPVRCDDVREDPRYGQWDPHRGIPGDHPPVRSYLAVPVASRNGEPVGGLFFGHSRPGVFTERTERLVVGIASQASVAIDNARLFDQTRRVAIERERLIEAERAARADIARVSRLKDEFLATLSHELRTPLTAILGWAKVLLNKPGDAATLMRGVEAIERNASAQARLIDDLLDMNRIISGKVRLDVQPVELQRVLDAAVDSVRPSIEARDIRFRITIDPLAGPVSGDPSRLQQVVWNLLSNAIKFTPHGGSVEMSVQRAGDQVLLSVRDSGCGIPVEFMPHLFDRFRQADSSTTRSHGGLGLGLSIVKHLVELHGGEVTATSEGVGRGATFTVWLPALAIAATAPHAGPVASGGRSSSAPLFDIDLGGLTILVVDDEPDARDLIRHLLEDSRATVHTARSADEASEMLPRVRPDLLLSDIGMPGRDGYQLIREVRRLPVEQGGRTPAIALTAFARPEDRIRSMIAGYQVHVAKPIDPRELVATVASLTGRNTAA